MRIRDGKLQICVTMQNAKPLGKKARRALDAEKRATWSFSPVTRKVENKKHYDRKKSAHVWKDDFGMSAFCLS